MALFFVNADAAYGTFKSNPYTFAPNGVSKITAQFESKVTPNVEELTQMALKRLDPATDALRINYWFNELVNFAKLQIGDTKADPGIDWADFVNNSAIFVLKLDNNVVTNQADTIESTGSLRLNIHFSKKLEQSTNIMMMSTFQSSVTCGSSKLFQCNYLPGTAG